MKLGLPLFAVFLLSLTEACTKERVYENIFEGMQKREQIVNPSDEPIPPKQPNYEEYKRERD